MRFTVTIPVLNQETLILRALDSIPRRDDLCVLICDDGSTDNTFEVVKKYMETHNDIKIDILRNEKNIGLGLTKNRLYDNVLDGYVLELDSDDYYYTEELNKALDKVNDEDIVYISLKTNDGSIFKITPDNRMGFCSGAMRIIKRKFMGDIRCPDVKAGEDWFLTEKLNAKNPTELYTNIVAYHYNFPRDGSLYDLMTKGKL